MVKVVKNQGQPRLREGPDFLPSGVSEEADAGGGREIERVLLGNHVRKRKGQRLRPGPRGAGSGKRVAPPAVVGCVRATVLRSLAGHSGRVASCAGDQNTASARNVERNRFLGASNTWRASWSRSQNRHLGFLVFRGLCAFVFRRDAREHSGQPCEAGSGSAPGFPTRGQRRLCPAAPVPAAAPAPSMGPVVLSPGPVRASRPSSPFPADA